MFPFGGRVLAATCDGVGTKVKLAIKFDRHEVVGEDLVAMSINDLIAAGAKPLFFLDYFSCGKLKSRIFKRVLSGIEKGLKKSNCILLGGETAEMPGMYSENDYDLAGFACGEVVRKFNSSKISSGDVIIGIRSNGLHSNGFSLVRKIFTTSELKRYKDMILKPTRIYSLLLNYPSLKYIKNVAHVTGGGIRRAIKRLLGAHYEGDIFKYRLYGIFKIMADKGMKIKEMENVFNMGWGMLLVANESDAAPIIKETKGRIIGRVR